MNSIAGKKSVQFYLFLLAVLTVSQLFSILAFAQSTPMETIDGTIWYRERILMPPDAEIMVSLVDVAKMDVAATVIASKRFEINGAPPWNFTLYYDPQKLNDMGRYALQAGLEANGRPLFITTSLIPVFDHDATKGIKILLNRVPTVERAPQTDASLSNTYWKAVELNGSFVSLGAGEKELRLVLHGSKRQAKGFSGCNNFTGRYTQEKQFLKIGSVVATMMACSEAMEQEQQFLQALEKVKRFTISGDNLVFYDAEYKVLLRFNAVYLQ